MNSAIKEELEYLYQVLEELERKFLEKNGRLEELKDEIEFINKEKDNLKKYIDEKEDENVRAEIELKQLLREKFQDQDQVHQRSYSDISSAASTALDSTPIVRARIIPVKNNGEPAEELGNSKWTKKK